MPRSIYGSVGETARVPYKKTEQTQKKKYYPKKKRTSAISAFSEKLVKALYLDKLLSFFYPFFDYLVKKALPEDSAFSIKIKVAHLQYTSFLYRTTYISKHAAKVIGLIFIGILKTVLPIIIPLLGVALVSFSIWAMNTYSIALSVNFDSEHIAYVSDQQTFDDIRASVENRIYASGEGEYIMSSIPTLQFVVIPKDNISDTNEIADTLYNSYQEFIGQSYGFFIDGVLVGTSRTETDITRILNTVVLPYLSGEKGESYNIINKIEIVRDTYPKSYEKSYEEMLALFTTPLSPEAHTVAKNETAASIASKYGISVPVLALLNGSKDINSLTAGETLNVGQPNFELRVQTIRYVSYTEIIPYETKYIYTDSLYEGSRQTKQQGSNGVYDVTAEIREVNGVETYREETAKKKVKDPIAQQILVGTKTIAPSGKFIWPLENGVGYVSSGFGYRTLRGVYNFHRGTDIAANYGTKILAADAGVVVEYGWDSNGLGNYVAIDHGNGIISYYGHCSSLNKSISKGSKVYQGQVIAYVGSTGNSTGNHVHFALYNTETGSYFDALPYIKQK